jgi:hypothetical protein
MPTADINYVAVLVAALLFMAVGFVWYALPVFGKSWMRETGLKEKDLKDGPGTGYALAMFAGLVQAYVLAHFVDYVGADTWSQGAATGIWVGVGFVAMAIAANYVFAKRSAQLWLIDSGYFVVSLALSGALLAVWV